MATDPRDLGRYLAEAFQAGIREQLSREVSVLSRLSRESRKGHWEEDPEARARYDDFEKRWNALIEEGFANDFLMKDYDGLCLDVPPGTWVYDETEEEHQQRLKREGCDIGTGGHVVFPVAKGPRP